MKSLLLLTLSLLISFSAFSQDMSRTETYEDSYRDLDDGSTEYIGGCSVHQDYEGKLFDVTETLVESFEPTWKNPKETMKKLSHVDKDLLAIVAGKEELGEFYSNLDDISLEKISSRIFKKLDLYRFNIGVGGGNGYYSVYSREVVKGKVSWNHVSYIFDGDMEYCDKSVWLKK